MNLSIKFKFCRYLVLRLITSEVLAKPTACMDLSDDENKHAKITLAGKYQLKKIIGQGSFGKIYRASVKDTDNLVAVKLEQRASNGYVSLARESKTLAELTGCPGFPTLYAYGREENFSYMVVSLLGPNLEKLLKVSGRTFSLKTVLMLADQMLTRIEALHEMKYIHRDIKPENFVMGLGPSSKNLFMIDFGLARKFVDASGEHIGYKESKGLIGTARYASINAHLGIEQTRRDDLEAIGYTLIYFAKGKLPWQNIPATTKQQKYFLISEKKQKTPLEDLCEGLPVEFVEYLTYVKKLGFSDAPDYKYLRKLFRKLFVERGFDFDYSYDWTHQTNKMSKMSFDEDFFLYADPRMKKNSFGRPKMANALNLKSKNTRGAEESKGAESEEEYATTVKLSKGVAFENQMRVANNLKGEAEVSSSENTSKVLHVSELRLTKANEDELLPDEAEVKDLLSRKCEHLLIFKKMRSIEDCDGPIDRVAIERRQRSSYRKSISLHTRSMPRQSNFGKCNTKHYDEDDAVDDWNGTQVRRSFPN